MKLRDLLLSHSPTAKLQSGLLLALALTATLTPQPTAAQSAFYWSGAGADANWSTADNWWGGVAPTSPQATLNFTNGAGLLNLNDFAPASPGYQILFGGGAGSFTLGGNSILFYDWGGSPPRIENDSASPQTVNLPIVLGNNSGGGLQINPVTANLTVGSAVNLNGNSLQIWGNNGNSLTFPAGAIVSGTGSTVALNQNSQVIFQDAEMYTGDTFVNAGTLELAANNALASAVVRLGDTTGSANATLQLDNGLSLGSSLNVRAGSTGTKTFGNATNGTGNATFNGALYLDANATVYANSNGAVVLAGSPLDLKAQALTLDGPGNTTISGDLANSTCSGSLVKNGPGTAILIGNNTYSGPTTITGGTLQVGSGGTSGSLGAGIVTNVSGGGAVAFNRSDSITLNNQFITSSGGGVTLYQNGTGTLTLAGTADNVSCTPVVNAGTLVLGKTSSGSAHAVGGVGTINAGGTVKLGGTGGDQIWGGAGFAVNSGGTFDMAGLSESFGTLSGSGTVINSGAAASSLTLGENNYSSSAFSGTINDGSQSGAKITLTKIGTGTLTLGGANTYSGGTFANGGTLNVSADNNLGAPVGGLTFGGGTLHATASFASSRSVAFTGAGTFAVDSGTTLSLNNGLNNAAAKGASAMNLNGGGTLSIKGNATINNDNPLTVNNATLEIDPGSSGLINATNKLVLGNATGSATLNLKSGTVNFGQTDFFVMADSTSANSAVNVVGGTLNLYMTSGQRIMVGSKGTANFNIAGGAVNIAAAVGNIQIGGDSQYSDNNASGTLTLSSGTLAVQGSGSFLFGNNSTGKTGATGRLNLFGGTLSSARNLTGSNGSSYALFSGGTLKPLAASTTFLQTFTSAAISTNGLILDVATNITIPQALLHDAGLTSADGGLLKKGSAALTLPANNTYSGGTVLSGGTLNIAADNNLGAAAGPLTLGGGTLHATASLGTARAITVTNNTTFQVDTGATLTLANGFSDAAANNTANVTFNGGGTLSLRGPVSIANDNGFLLNASTLNVDLGGGTFNSGGKFTVGNAAGTATVNFLSGIANFTGPEFFAVADGGSTVNGVLNLQGGLMNVNLGANMRMLLANQGTANVNISGGALVIGASTGNLQLGGDIQWDGNNASGTITLSGTGSMTVNGVGGVFELGRNTGTHTGAKGTINLLGGTLTSARSITGGNSASFFNFNGGILAAGANNSTFLQGLSAANVGANGAIIDTANYAVTIAQGLLHDTNVLGTDGGLLKLGSGDLTLSGASTYSGPTLVAAGRLFVNGALGTNTVTVTNGAALLGAGTINGPVSIQSGATLQPGSDMGIGTLTVNSNVTLAGTTVMLLNKTNAQTASRLVTTANLSFNFGNTLTVTNTGPALQAGDTFTLFTATSYSNALTMVYPPPLAPGLEWDFSMLGVNGTLIVATVPSVTVSPSSTNAECASTVTLVATAGGTPPLTYQWYDIHTNAIAGATNATLTLTNVTSAKAGNYTVVVMNNVDSAYASAAVTVSDTTAPVITLNGPNPMTVECRSAFTDPGATALDACAGAVPVVVSGMVDPNTVGVYTLTYTADDGSGNVTNATRTVTVADTTAPTITWSFTNLTLNADATCQALMPDVTGTNYILAADAGSETLTITQTPTNNAVLVLGTNEVVIAVADAAGNTAYSTNTIVVADTTAPAITLLGDNPLTNELHAAFIDPGFTAADTCSGVVSVSTNNPVDVDTPGVYTISYVAQDAIGNAATNTRTVVVVQTIVPLVAPVITSQQLLASGSFQLQFTGPSGQTYKVLASPDLSQPISSWSVLTNGTFSTDPASFTDPDGTLVPARFYRITSP